MSTPVFTTNQPSFTEWFAAIGRTQIAQAIRKEDNSRTDRLELLFQSIGLPYERPVRFSARALLDRKPEFLEFLAKHGKELCALRLVADNPNLPKFRNRGPTLSECYEKWLPKQQFDPAHYTAEIYPHTDQLLWSSIFVVNSEAIFGEIVEGMHAQLTHGDTKNAPHRFFFDHHSWCWDQEGRQAREQVERMLSHLLISDPAKQRVLAEQLGATFSHDYLCGYFETTVWPENKPYFIDYNRVLGKRILTPPKPSISRYLGKSNTTAAGEAVLSGMVAHPGSAHGRVVIVTEQNLGSVDFPDGSILVCDNTDVRYLPLMKRAAAIVTDRGGLLSHAAIVARELGVPCIVGAGEATSKLRDGQLVEVDASNGVVRR